MRTFSQLTGLSPTVLRAWESRHGLLEPARPDGGHRLYTEDDLQVIQRVTHLLSEGRAIGEIAAVGREALLAKRARTPEVPPEDTGSLGAFRAQIIQSAAELDSDLLTATLDRAFALFSLDVVLTHVIQPAAYEIGERWAAGTMSVAGEHLVSSVLSGRIERLRQTMAVPNHNSPSVVCGCIPGEQHELGLLVLSLRIASAGYRVAYLGRNLPLAELEAATQRLKAGAVCLSAKRVEVLEPCAGDLAELAERWSGRVRVHLGGIATAEAFPGLVESGVRLWGRDFDMQTLFDDLFDLS